MKCRYGKVKILPILMIFFLCACGTQKEISMQKTDENVTKTDFNSLSFTECGDITYATEFSIMECGEYRLITIVDCGRFLLISKEDDIPDNLPSDITVIRKPINNVYLTSSSVFDMLREIDALDNLRFSGTKASDLCIEEALEKMEQGDILYAGKYSSPDYELLVSEGCDLSIENTMIFHNPQSMEKLIDLDIPVLVERSSYEKHPCGRLEWIKLYGALFDKEDEAESFFNKQKEEFEKIAEMESTGCEVAFFYINTNGAVNVRKSNDYIAEIVRLSGGEYFLKEEQDDNNLSTMNMQMEDFYLAAKDADVLIYNGTTTGELFSMEELLEKSPLLSDFKAVNLGRVYSTGKNFFQETTAMGDLIKDISCIIHDEDDGTNLHQLKKLQ